MDSWHKLLPDYQFILWNEKNFDVNSVPFTKQAYENKKWAFVSDYVRIYALFHYGGWYLDTDVEVIRSLDPFCEKQVVLGTDEEGALTALMGSEAHQKIWEDILRMYGSMSFILEDGSCNLKVNNSYIQDHLALYGFQMSNRYQKLEDGIEIYPDDYFHAVSMMTGDPHITRNTYAIHWHTLTWTSKKAHLIRFFRVKVLIPIFGSERVIKFIYSLRERLGIGDK